MRTEKDRFGTVQLPDDALYGIHAFRARENFPGESRFHAEWYRAMGTTKLACYQAYERFSQAVKEQYPQLVSHLRLPDPGVVTALQEAASEVAGGMHFEHFVVPAVQGGAGTSINMNINEIIANTALLKMGKRPGDYDVIDPIESANVYQSTNDVVPTALTVAVMELLNELEAAINRTRGETEKLETRYRSTIRLAYTQMQEAVPSTYGQLFSGYSEALSRDWWRVSKGFERIKQINLGGGATGTGISIPRFYLMEAPRMLKRLTGLPLSQAENLPDATANQDGLAEVHAIVKVHAINLEKIARDLRLLSSGLHEAPDIRLPAVQTGSSIMPGKVNPVISEYIVSGVHRVYEHDQLITRLSGQGDLDLNAYLPSIGDAMLDSLKTLIRMDEALTEKMLKGLEVDEEAARGKLLRSVAVTTALSPFTGYHQAARLARTMQKERVDIVEANRQLGLMEEEKLNRLMMPDQLLKKGFTMKEIEDFSKESS